MFLRLAGFVITWTPYAVVSLYSAFIDSNAITPIGSTIPALFAKSSMLWSTLLYLLTNKSIKSKMNLSLLFKTAKKEKFTNM